MKKCVILILMCLTVSKIFSAERLTVSIANRTINSGIYYADIKVNVPSSDNKWLAAASTIVVKYNSSGLNLTDLDGVNVQNLDSDLSNSGYSCTQTDFGPGFMAVNLFTTNPNVNKSGDFRLCTVRWNIVSTTQYDSLKYDSDQCEIFNGLDLMLDYNCSTPSCYKIVNPEPKLLQVAAPTLTTTTPSSVNSTSASSGGNVTNDGGASVTARGVCWATTQNPTTANSKTSDGTGTGTYTSSITGLSPSTKYYVRAYATNSVGTSYGNQDSLTTTAGATIPTVTTANISDTTSNSATCGGNVTNDGGASVTARGVCWDTTANPTIAKSKTTDGSGTGSFTSSLTGLSANTNYYVRAYATNSVGTGYGEQKTFKTDTSSIIDVPNSWDFTELTGNNSTIVVDTSIHPKIGERDFLSGDAIGLFFTRDNQKICAGYSIWTGINLQIIVWGDDSETTLKDGFVVNETYTVKIWDSRAGKEYDANVTYSIGNNYYTVNGFSVMGSLSAITTVTHEISMTQGWNMISTFAEPENKSMPVVWDNIKSFVTLVKNNAGQAYIPAYGINNIGNWNKYEGYQTYLTQAKTLSITGIGIKPENTPISLTAGWKLCPYLRNSPQSIVTAVASLTSDNALTIAKNNSGQAYIPAYGINNIGNMQPGQGYQMYLSKNSTLTYPANSQGRASAGESVTPMPKVLIPEHHKTGNNAVLLVQIEADDGNEIGVYNQNDEIIGSGVVQNNIASVTIWGDDEQTEITDGAVLNSELRIMNYELKSGRLSDVDILGLEDFITGEKVDRLSYWKDAVYFAKACVIQNSSNISMNVRPNPASDIIEIEFSTHDCQATELSIYTIDGKLISNLSGKLHDLKSNPITHNISNFSSGEYTIILTCENERAMRKIVVVK